MNRQSEVGILAAGVRQEAIESDWGWGDRRTAKAWL